MPSEPAERVVLDYSVPAGCDGRVGFIAQVRAYTERAELIAETEVESAAELRRFSVRVTTRQGQFQGVLSVESNDTTARRDFAGQTCSEIVQTLALATALAIDPESLGGAPAPPPPPEPAAKPPKEEPPAPPPSASGPFLSLQLGPRLHTGTAPDTVTLGGAAGVEVSRHGVWQHALSLHGWYGASSELERFGATFRFVAYSGRVQYCPIKFGQGSSWIDACAAVEVGRLRGERLDVGEEVSELGLHAAGGVALRATWMGSSLFFRARVDAAAAWARPEFRLENLDGEDPLVFKAPLLSAAAMLSVGLRFGR